MEQSALFLHQLNPGIHAEWVWPVCWYIKSRGEKQKCVPSVRSLRRLNSFDVVGRSGHHSWFLHNFIFQRVNLIPLQLFIFIYIKVANVSEVLLGLQLRMKMLSDERNKLNFTISNVYQRTICRCVRDVQITDWLFRVGFGHYFR